MESKSNAEKAIRNFSKEARKSVYVENYDYFHGRNLCHNVSYLSSDAVRLLRSYVFVTAT